MEQNKDLCSFQCIKEIINGIDQEKIISYDGNVGTSQQTGVPPYQVVELRVAFYDNSKEKRAE